MKLILLTKRSLVTLGLSLMIGVTAATVAITSTVKAVQTAAEPRKIPVYRVESDKKQVAISFDAAWGNEQTSTLLDILDQYGVKSTFFLVGDWVENYPDDVKEIFSRGHDVGNHSATHPHMAQLSKEEQLKEIDSCNEAVKALTDHVPTLFRAPYGEYDNNLVSGLKERDMYCVQWNIDSLDWKDPSPDEMVNRIKEKLCPGSVILMHNGATNTPEALPKIIEMIQGEGYIIVPISQLIPEGDYYTDHEGKMILNE